MHLVSLVGRKLREAMTGRMEMKSPLLLSGLSIRGIPDSRCEVLLLPHEYVYHIYTHIYIYILCSDKHQLLRAYLLGTPLDPAKWVPGFPFSL